MAMLDSKFNICQDLWCVYARLFIKGGTVSAIRLGNDINYQLPLLGVGRSVIPSPEGW
jgi:hypothetical protein